MALDDVQTEAAHLIGPPPAPIRIGHSPLVAASLVAAAHRSLRPPHDGVGRRIDVRQDHIGPLIDSLTTGDRDLILIPSLPVAPHSGRRTIRSERLVLIEPERDGGPACGLIQLNDLTDRHLILLADTCGLTRYIRKLFEDNELRLTPHLAAADSYRSLERWSRAGMGSALIPLSKLGSPASPHRDVVDAAGCPIEITFDAVWDPAAELLDDIEHFVELLVAHAPTSVVGGVEST